MRGCKQFQRTQEVEGGDMVELAIADSDRIEEELGRSKAEARSTTTKPLPLYLFIGLNFLLLFETP